MSSIPSKYSNQLKKREEIYKFEKVKECPIILKCGCLTTTTIPEDTLVGSTFILATLTLDKSCICESNTKLDFTSSISFRSFSGNITLRIFKRCRNQLTSIPVGSDWIINLGSDVASVTGSNILSFFVCDEALCKEDCCIYTVVARVNSITAVSTITFNNSSLSGIVSCNSSCHKNCKKL